MPQTGQRTVAILCCKEAGPNRGRGGNEQAGTMTSTLHKSATRKASLAEACDAPNGGFKRLALPAVAAAVQTLAQARPQETAPQDRSRRAGKLG